MVLEKIDGLGRHRHTTWAMYGQISMWRIVLKTVFPPSRARETNFTFTYMVSFNSFIETTRFNFSYYCTQTSFSPLDLPHTSKHATSTCRATTILPVAPTSNASTSHRASIRAERSVWGAEGSPTERHSSTTGRAHCCASWIAIKVLQQVNMVSKAIVSTSSRQLVHGSQSVGEKSMMEIHPGQRKILIVLRAKTKKEDTYA